MTPKTRTLVFSLGALAAMIGLVAASVPLYSLFCKATGAGGTPKTASAPSAGGISGQTVEIRFDAAVMKDVPWRFAPERTAMTVHLGETNLAIFTATNQGKEALTGTAAFNVMPAKAGPYVDKIQCFCFSEQRIAAGQTVDMPVSFFIDPAIAADPLTNDVHTITLSYTFFKSRQQADAPADAKAAGASVKDGRS